MRALVQLCLLIVGLLLLVSAAVLSWTRREPAAPQGMLFRTAEGMNWQLYRARPDGREVAPFVRGADFYDLVAQSPDEKWLYLQAYSTDQRAQDIYRVRPNSSRLENLTQNPASSWFVTLSPDGKWLIFQSEHEDGRLRLYRMPTEGGAAQRVTEHIGVSFETWSPNGETLIYTSWGRGTADLYQVQLTDAYISQPQRLTYTTGAARFVDWSPDGESFIFGGYSGQNFKLYRSSLKPDFAQNENENQSSAGESGLAANSAVLEPELEAAVLAGMLNNQGDDGRTTALTFGTGQDIFQSWSPDGEWLIYTAHRGALGELFRIRADGSAQERLTNMAGIEIFADWSPDGEWLIFHGFLGGRRVLYQMRADGAQTQRLTHTLGDEGFKGWSPDGEWLLFRSIQNGKSILYRQRFPIWDGLPQRLTPPHSFSIFKAWSPDGEWLLFWSDRDGRGDLYRIPTAALEHEPAAQRVTFMAGDTEFVAWLPQADLAWRPLILLGLGLGLLLSAFSFEWRRKWLGKGRIVA